MLTFQIESFPEFYSDPQRDALWREHYEEFDFSHKSKMAFSPYVEVYQALDASGALLIVTAREGKELTLVGYCFVIIQGHMHYSGTLCGIEDAYYLSKRCRKGLAGYKMLRYSLKMLKARGVVKAFFMTKENLSIARLLERLGGTKSDSVYSFWLDEGDL